MKWKTRITTLVFVILLFGLAILNIAWPKKTFSENENRILAAMPEISFQNLIDGDLTKDFETYITDHFVFRDTWVGGKTLLELGLQKKDSGGVYFARDGYLIEILDRIDSVQYEKNLNFIKAFANAMKQTHNIDVRTMLVPTASYTLSDKLPPFAPNADQDKLIEQAVATVPNFVDLRETLKAHKEEYIYYRTDHHWTSLGVYYGYQAWCAAAGIEEKPLDWYRQEVMSDTFLGTTYSKANLYTVKPDTMTAFLPQTDSAVTVDYNQGKKITDTMYEKSHLDTKDKYSVFLDGNQPVVKISTEHKNGKKLLIIKDSYANSFAPFAADDYEEVYLVDLRHYRAPLSQFIEESGVNEILILYNLSGFISDTNIFMLGQ